MQSRSHKVPSKTQTKAMKVAEMKNRNYLDYPFIGVGVVVWDNSRFLLVKRAKSPRKGEWSIPGGRQVLGETTRETASREIQEEASIRIKILGLVDVVDSIIKDKNHTECFLDSSSLDLGKFYVRIGCMKYHIC